VSLHLPLTDETHHLLGEKELKMMKRSAILINTARGAVVDEPALIRLLKQERIAGAGFDVYEQEPFIPKELMELKNVVLLPHIGSASIETRTEMAVMAAKNAIAVIKGQEPLARVN
jgi:glyoxylate reductase